MDVSGEGGSTVSRPLTLSTEGACTDARTRQTRVRSRATPLPRPFARMPPPNTHTRARTAPPAGSTR